MKTIYKIKTYICTYVILIMTFVVLLCCSYYIPINKENMRESAELLYQEGVFPNYKENIKKISGQDNFTDSLMLNIISTMNENEDVLSAIMRMDYLQEQDGEFNSVDDLYDIYTINASNHIFEKVSYARYWHGYVVYLKPLMLIFNFHQLRIFMFVCIYSLLIICLYCIAKKIGIKYTIAFLAGFIIIDINNICYSVQYFNVFL